MPKTNKKSTKKSHSSVHSSAHTAKPTKHGVLPLADRVLIKEDSVSREQKTATGIIIPASVAEDKGSKRGEVMVVGPGRTEDGKLIPVMVKPGDVVLFQWGDKVKHGDDEFYLVRESEILAVIK